MSDGSTTRSSGLVLMTHPPGVEQGRCEDVIVWMSRPVAARLRALGFEQPVELDSLPGKWWSILVDLEALDMASEPGCGFGRTMATTEVVANYHSMYWTEIAAGPFDQFEDAAAVYLAAADTDTSWLGPNARVNRVAPWISRALAARGFGEPVGLKNLAGMYWVCGMSCCTTVELEVLIRGARAAVDISDGPFEQQEDAQHYVDRMWESPE